MAAEGSILFIVNPVSKNGKGIGYVPHIEKAMEARGLYDIVLTEEPGHAYRIARDDTEHGTIISVSGDGTAHEVINGIMAREETNRPVFSAIPVGSGNDYCRTLDIPLSNADEALKAVLEGEIVPMDLGRCNDFYFLESISFGLDAAIAIETMQLRLKTDQSGIMLYLNAGLRVLKDQFRSYDVNFSLDELDAKKKDLLMLSFTVGATYGGGFQIAPDADPCDGLFNYCFTHSTKRMKALGIFGLAMKGKHTKVKSLQMGKVAKAEVDFDEQLPVQADGEKIYGTNFKLELLPKAYRVLAPANSRVVASNR